MLEIKQKFCLRLRSSSLWCCRSCLVDGSCQRVNTTIRVPTMPCGAMWTACFCFFSLLAPLLLACHSAVHFSALQCTCYFVSGFCVYTALLYSDGILFVSLDVWFLVCLVFFLV